MKSDWRFFFEKINFSYSLRPSVPESTKDAFLHKLVEFCLHFLQGFMQSFKIKFKRTVNNNRLPKYWATLQYLPASLCL